MSFKEDIEPAAVGRLTVRGGFAAVDGGAGFGPSDTRLVPGTPSEMEARGRFVAVDPAAEPRGETTVRVVVLGGPAPNPGDGDRFEVELPKGGFGGTEGLRVAVVADEETEDEVPGRVVIEGLLVVLVPVAFVGELVALDAGALAALEDFLRAAEAAGFAVAAVVLAALDTTGAAGLVVPTPAELELITWRQRGAQELLYRNEIDDTEQHVQHAPFSRAESGP